MKKELRIILLFGFAQLLLSLIVWGQLEYSILLGDMVETSKASFLAFVLGDRLLHYLSFSIANCVLFALLSMKFGAFFHPGFMGATILAFGTVALAIPFTIYSVFQVPYFLVVAVAFLVAAIIYGLISRALEKLR